MEKKSILLAENVAYEVTSSKTLFQGVHVSLEEGDRIALVGRNGVGKSTLLQILASQLVPTSGSISRHGTVYYLPQDRLLIENIQLHLSLGDRVAMSNDKPLRASTLVPMVQENRVW